MKNIDIIEIVELKKQGLTDKQIVEHYNKKGLTISRSSIQQKLKKYYDDIGEEKPKVEYKKEVPMEEVIKLIEKKMSEEKMLEYLKERGINVSNATLRKRIAEYYEERGEEKPEKKKLFVEEMVKLKKAGLTDTGISQYLKEQGILVSNRTVSERLKEYYAEQGEEKPKVEYKKQLPIEEIITLKEKNYTDYRIAKYLERKGIQVTPQTVGKRIKEHYEAKGKKKTRVEYRKDLPVKVIIKLKERGYNDTQIVNFLKQEGIKITCETMNRELTDYYGEIGLPEEISFTRIGRTQEKYNNDIKYMLMNGITLEQYIEETGKEEERKNIEITIEKLRFLAQHTDKRVR